jgi:hypothetical protein
MGAVGTYLNEQVDDLVWVRNAQRAELQHIESDHICGIKLVDEVILVGSDSHRARRHTSLSCMSWSIVRAPKLCNALLPNPSPSRPSIVAGLSSCRIVPATFCSRASANLRHGNIARNRPAVPKPVSKERNRKRTRDRLQSPRCAAGQLGSTVNAQTLTTLSDS